MQLKNDTFEELAVAYGRLRKHAKLSESRGHTFSTLAFGVIFLLENIINGEWFFARKIDPNISGKLIETLSQKYEI